MHCEKIMADQMRIGDLQISLAHQRVVLVEKSVEQPINLTGLEFKLLTTLGRHPTRVFTREFLLDQVWGDEVNVTDRTVDAHIAHLRKKLKNSAVKIETVIGSGYRLLA